MSWGSLWSQLSGKGDMEVNVNESMSPEYPEFLGANSDRLIQLNQQTESPQDALGMLKQLADEDPAYKELYIQLLAERENQERAYQWYEDFNNSYYQRTTKDLEAAGLNPWLALQSLGSSGSGSLTPAGTWSGSSGSSQKVKREEIAAQKGQKIGTSIIAAIAAIAGAIIMAML